MAITLSSRTEAILDAVLRALNADTLRLPEVPQTAQISGHLRAQAAAGQVFVQVDNGHLWPKEGYIRFPGTNDELAHYRSLASTTGRTKAPSWTGVGNTPTVVLRCDANLANTHQAGEPVYIVPGDFGQRARAVDSGLVGVHDLSALLKQFRIELTAGTLTATGGSTSTVQDTGAFIADSQVGNLVTILTGAAAGETAYVASNTADVLTLASTLDNPVANTDTYTITPAFFDVYIDEMDNYYPPNYTSAQARGSADRAKTPGILGTTMVAALAKIIEQFGGTTPTTDTALELLARDVDLTTYLTVATAATDLEIHVADASVLPSTGNLLIGSTVGTIYRNNAGKQGQGPNTIRLTAAIGAIEAASAVVSPSPRGTITRNRSHIAPRPHAYGNGMEQWVLAAVAAIEGTTIPVV